MKEGKGEEIKTTCKKSSKIDPERQDLKNSKKRSSKDSYNKFSKKQVFMEDLITLKSR